MLDERRLSGLEDWNSPYANDGPTGGPSLPPSLGVRARIEAADELQRGDAVKEKALERQVEQLEYEAKRAFEQYNEVDPRNRLVASELERRWNETLQECERAKQELALARAAPPSLDR